jgi:hypothetical protein
MTTAMIMGAVLLTIFSTLIGSPAAFSAPSTNSGPGGSNSGNATDQTQDRGLAWTDRQHYFWRALHEWKVFKADTLAPVDGNTSGQGIKKSVGPATIHHFNPNGEPGYVYSWPVVVPDLVSKVPTNRDTSIAGPQGDLLKTTGFILSDTQYQVIHRYNQNLLLERLFDPEMPMWTATTLGGLASTSVANSMAGMAVNQTENAIGFVQRYLVNFTAEPNNVWQKLRDNLFLPMAILLLLPGAVLAQGRAIVAQGSPILGEISPFEGLTRSIVAIFLIPGSFLVMNYGIDVSNSITFTISDEFQRIFHGNMYDLAKCAEETAEVANPQNRVDNAIIQGQPPNTQGPTPEYRYEVDSIDLRRFDPCAGIDQTQVADEEVNADMPVNRLAMNTANAGLGMTWNIMCAFQMAYLYYLWCMGPVAAALWVWPMERLRGAFPSWVEGVVTLCFWALFWNTVVLLMACFRGTGDTGTVIMTALNGLATLCVQYAFDFSSLVSQGAASQLAGMVAQGMRQGANGGPPAPSSAAAMPGGRFGAPGAGVGGGGFAGGAGGFAGGAGGFAGAGRFAGAGDGVTTTTYDAGGNIVTAGGAGSGGIFGPGGAFGGGGNGAFNRGLFGEGGAAVTPVSYTAAGGDGGSLLLGPGGGGFGGLTAGGGLAALTMLQAATGMSAPQLLAALGGEGNVANWLASGGSLDAINALNPAAEFLRTHPDANAFELGRHLMEAVPPNSPLGEYLATHPGDVGTLGAFFATHPGMAINDPQLAQFLGNLPPGADLATTLSERFGQGLLPPGQFDPSLVAFNDPNLGGVGPPLSTFNPTGDLTNMTSFYDANGNLISGSNLYPDLTNNLTPGNLMSGTQIVDSLGNQYYVDPQGNLHQVGQPDPNQLANPVGPVYCQDPTTGQTLGVYDPTSHNFYGVNSGNQVLVDPNSGQATYPGFGNVTYDAEQQRWMYGSHHNMNVDPTTGTMVMDHSNIGVTPVPDANAPNGQYLTANVGGHELRSFDNGVTWSDQAIGNGSSVLTTYNQDFGFTTVGSNNHIALSADPAHPGYELSGMGTNHVPVTVNSGPDGTTYTVQSGDHVFNSYDNGNKWEGTGALAGTQFNIDTTSGQFVSTSQNNVAFDFTRGLVDTNTGSQLTYYSDSGTYQPVTTHNTMPHEAVSSGDFAPRYVNADNYTPADPYLNWNNMQPVPNSYDQVYLNPDTGTRYVVNTNATVDYDQQGYYSNAGPYRVDLQQDGWVVNVPNANAAFPVQFNNEANAWQLTDNNPVVTPTANYENPNIFAAGHPTGQPDPYTHAGANPLETAWGPNPNETVWGPNPNQTAWGPNPNETVWGPNHNTDPVPNNNVAYWGEPAQRPLYPDHEIASNNQTYMPVFLPGKQRSLNDIVSGTNKNTTSDTSTTEAHTGSLQDQVAGLQKKYKRKLTAAELRAAQIQFARDHGLKVNDDGTIETT